MIIKIPKIFSKIFSHSYFKCLFLAIAVIFAALPVSSLYGASAAGKGKGNRTGNTVTSGDFIQNVVLSGSLEAQKAEIFTVPVTNTWQIQLKWMVDEGAVVEPGQPVVRFDSSSITSDIYQLEDALLLKKEQKKQKQEDYQLREFELGVNVKKAEVAFKKAQLDANIPKGIESDYEYDKKQLELKKSRLALQTAQRDRKVRLENLKADIEKMDIEIREAFLQLEKSRIILDKLTLKATTAGPVVYGQNRYQGRKVQIGDNVSPGFTIATIPDKSSLKVTAWVNETDIRKVKAGQKVDMVLDAYPKKRFSGTLIDVLNNAEEKSRWGETNYFRASITLDTVDPEIMKPGMSIKCVVRVARFTGVHLIPISMAYFDGKDFWVKPGGRELMKIQPLGFNSFHIAVAAGEGSGPSEIGEGDVLQTVDADAVKNKKTIEKGGEK